MPPLFLKKFEIQNIIKTNLNLMVFFSRNNLPKIKDGAYVINLDEYINQ